MNQDLAAPEKELNAIPGYVAQFQAAFASRVTPAGIAKALAAFQRTLVSHTSPSQQKLNGDGNFSGLGALVTISLPFEIET